MSQAPALTTLLLAAVADLILAVRALGVALSAGDDAGVVAACGLADGAIGRAIDAKEGS